MKHILRFQLFTLLLSIVFLFAGCAGVSTTTAISVEQQDPAAEILVDITAVPMQTGKTGLDTSEFTRDLPVYLPTGDENEVVVSSVDDFLAAIASNRTIYLESGSYDLTRATGYGKQNVSDAYTWIEVNDGYGLSIQNVENLSIIGHHAGDVAMITEPRYANVLSFIDCSNVSICGITAGHSQGPGFCSGGVLYYESTANAKVTESVLYGCGTLGVDALDCENLQFEQCSIQDCSLGGVNIARSRNVTFAHCQMVNCGNTLPANAMISVDQSDQIVFNHCIISGNTTNRLLESSYTTNVQLLSSTIQDNRLMDAAIVASQYCPIVDGCVFSENEINSWYGSANGSAGMSAVKKDGKKLTPEDLESMEYAAVAPLMPSVQTSVDEPSGQSGQREVQVSTVDELLAAIASDTTVYLADGIYDLSKAANYGAYGQDGYYWIDEFDGPGLVINGVANLRIIGAGADKAFVYAVPRYANVLGLESCTDIMLSGITFGHAEAPGECTG